MKEQAISKVLWVVTFVTLFAFLPAKAQPAQGIDAWLTLFATDDGLGRAIAFDRFDKDVLPSQRASALDQVWQAAEGRQDRDLLRSSVLAYFYGKTAADLPWTNALRDHVQTAAGSQSSDLRRLAVMVIIKRNAVAEMRPTIIRALDDREELIRDLAVGEVARWPDFQPLLEGYVKKNQGNITFARTNERARNLLQQGGIK